MEVPAMPVFHSHLGSVDPTLGQFTQRAIARTYNLIQQLSCQLSAVSVPPTALQSHPDAHAYA